MERLELQMVKKALNLIFGTDKVFSILPGLILAAVIAVISFHTCRGICAVTDMKSSPVSRIMVGILLGILIRNTVGVPNLLTPGIKFSLKKLLRFGIILMGIRMSIFSVARIGVLAVGIAIVCIFTGLAVTIFVTRKLKLSDRLGTLIAVGTGICGVSAIAATAPAIGAKDEEVAYAVGTITIFGMLALLVYPYITHLLLGLSNIQAGIFMGTSIHDTAQATGAGMMYDQMWMGAQKAAGPTSMDVAVVTKLVRNTFMAVVVPLIAYIHVKKHGTASSEKTGFIKLFPVFVLGFIMLAVVRSLGDYFIAQRSLLWNANSWDALRKFVQTWSGHFLATAMVSVGLGTDLRKFRQMGIRPFLVGLFAALTVGIVSFILIRLFVNA